MLPKLMLPKTLIITLIILPIRLHIRQQVIASLALQNRRDVFVFPGSIAVLLVRAVAVIGPKTMDRPRISRTSRRVVVPELRLEECTTRSVEAARIGGWNGSCVVAAKGEV